MTDPIRARLDLIWAMPNDRKIRAYSALRAVLDLPRWVADEYDDWGHGYTAALGDVLHVIAEHLGVNP